MSSKQTRFVGPMSAADRLPPRRGRQSRRYLDGQYVPRRRQRYGPRSGWAPIAPVSFPACNFRWTRLAVAQPMPRGGTRVLVRCPGCWQPRRRLYLTDGHTLSCRECLGLRYASRHAYWPDRRGELDDPLRAYAEALADARVDELVQAAALERLTLRAMVAASRAVLEWLSFIISALRQTAKPELLDDLRQARAELCTFLLTTQRHAA